MTSNELLTPQEAAEYLKISAHALRLMRAARREDGKTGPNYMKLGHKTLRYRKSDLDDYASRFSVDAEVKP